MTISTHFFRLSSVALALWLVAGGSFPQSFASPATQSAEETPDIPKPLKVMPSKIKPVQSASDELSKAAPENSPTKDGQDGDEETNLEALSPRDTAGFSPDFWAGLKRSDIASALRQISSPPATEPLNRSVRALALKLPLTPIADDLGDINDRADHLYALRLHSLGALGDFADAEKLYKMNEGTPPTPLAALAGIESALGSGEIAVACLDQKILTPELKSENPKFWANLDLFCQSLLSPVAGDDETLRLTNASRAYLEATKTPAPATADELNQLDLVTVLAFAKTDKLAPITGNPASLAALHAAPLALLANYAGKSTASFPIWAEAFRRGVWTGKKLQSALSGIDLTENPAKGSKPAKANPDIQFLKEYFKTTPPSLSDPLVKLADTPDKITFLLPFYQAPEIAFPTGNGVNHLLMLLKADQTIPPSLALAYTQPAESSGNIGATSEESGEKLLLASLLAKTKPTAEGQKNDLYATLLAVESALYPQNELKNPYDNILSLTESSNYVMPSAEILSSLRESADKKQKNQVVIKCLAILSVKPLEKLHPAALYRVLEALNSAGLNEETLSLSREVIGAVLEKLK